MTQVAPSIDDLYNDAKAAAVLKRPELNFNEGDISDMIAAAIAAVGDRVVGYEADLTRATYVDGAQGVDLTKLASDHWNITRISAVKSIGTVSLSRLTSAALVTVPAGTVVASERDALGLTSEFVTDDPLAFGIGVLGPLTVNVTAVSGGLAGNVKALKISRVVTTLPQTFTVTNAAPIIGGAEEESDPELRDRIRSFSTTLRRGTLAALEYGAKEVPQVKQSNAVEDGFGSVTVYVTDINGESNWAMVSDVIDELENWRAAGSNVVVMGGSPFGLNPITIQLSVRAGVNIAAITEDVKAAIVARVAKLKIGETCYREAIAQAALNVDIGNVIGCNVIAPAADVVPSSNQVIRTDIAWISVA